MKLIGNIFLVPVGITVLFAFFILAVITAIYERYGGRV